MTRLHALVALVLAAAAGSAARAEPLLLALVAALGDGVVGAGEAWGEPCWLGGDGSAAIRGLGGCTFGRAWQKCSKHLIMIDVFVRSEGRVGSTGPWSITPQIYPGLYNLSARSTKQGLKCVKDFLSISARP
jgi:hypothetical protein